MAGDFGQEGIVSDNRGLEGVFDTDKVGLENGQLKEGGHCGHEINVGGTSQKPATEDLNIRSDDPADTCRPPEEAMSGSLGTLNTQVPRMGSR